MKIWKNAVLFYLGGASYMALEFLWRGRSHGSMFLLGGGCFMALGQIRRLPMPLPMRAVLGAGVVTGMELATGLLVNQRHQVWDYTAMPMNYQGQICVPYSLLWIPVSLGAMLLYGQADKIVDRKRSKAFP